MKEELHAQAVILESLNTHLYQTQMELQKEVSPGWREDRGWERNPGVSAVWPHGSTLGGSGEDSF